jgi:hypothetical protein
MAGWLPWVCVSTWMISDVALSTSKRRWWTWAPISPSISRDVYKALDPAVDRIIIVAGDADYVPAIEAAKEMRF